MSGKEAEILEMRELTQGGNGYARSIAKAWLAELERAHDKRRSDDSRATAIYETLRENGR